MSDTTITTTLSKVLLTGPNLAYSVALQESLKRLEEYRKEKGENDLNYQVMLESLVAAILTQPPTGDA